MRSLKQIKGLAQEANRFMTSLLAEQGVLYQGSCGYGERRNLSGRSSDAHFTKGQTRKCELKLCMDPFMVLTTHYKREGLILYRCLYHHFTYSGYAITRSNFRYDYGSTSFSLLTKCEHKLSHVNNFF